MSIAAKKCKQPKCLSNDECINKMCIKINKKEWSTGTCQNIVETWKHYARWKKADTKDDV